MSFEFFISKRLIKSENTTSANRILRIAIVSVSLSVAVMLISISVLTGFKNSIKDKITGFGSHIQIIPFTSSSLYSDTPIYISDSNVKSLSDNQNIKFITPVLNKSAVIIKESSFHAIILKGITSSYDTTFFYEALVKGNMPHLNKNSKQEVIVSKSIADKMNLSMNDKIKIYFYINDSYRSKNFYVSGIYNTGLGDYDDRFLICDASILQNLFSFTDTSFSSYEVAIKDFSLLQSSAEYIYNRLPHHLTVQTITDIEPNLFSWLNLLDSNVIMIIIVMMLVIIVALSSVILIMIFESKKMIGTLKSFGASNNSIITIFLYKAGYTTLKGLLYGNILAITLELIQKYTHLIHLNPQSYYITSVPININPLHFILIDLGIFVICMFCMLIPTRSITKISIVKNLRFE